MICTEGRCDDGDTDGAHHGHGVSVQALRPSVGAAESRRDPARVPTLQERVLERGAQAPEGSENRIVAPQERAGGTPGVLRQTSLTRRREVTMAVVETTGSDGGSSAGALLLAGTAGALVGAAVRQPAVEEAWRSANYWYQRATQAESLGAGMRLQLAMAQQRNRAKDQTIAEQNAELERFRVLAGVLQLIGENGRLIGESGRQLGATQGEVAMLREILLGDEPENGEDQTP